jgi:hypothetical protein
LGSKEHRAAARIAVWAACRSDRADRPSPVAVVRWGSLVRLPRLSLLHALVAAVGLCACTSADGDGGPSSPSTTAATGGGGSGAASGGAAGEGGAFGGGGAGGAATGVPLAGHGQIAGDCGVLTPTELSSSSSYLYENSIDFASLTFDYAALSPGGQEVYDDGNLGGSSLYSEVFSYEVLYRCELAELLKTEGEIAYVDAAGTKTDLSVAVDELATGVSVTRAFKYPPTEPYSVTDALALLEDKLSDVLASTANVQPADGWSKQILHIMAYDDAHAASIAEAYAQVSPSVQADTIVLVTVTHGDDEFLY